MLVTFQKQVCGNIGNYFEIDKKFDKAIWMRLFHVKGQIW